MEVVRILGVDPSLRNTGLAIVNYNTELPLNDPKAFSAKHCQVLVNPQKYTGTDAILNMLDMMHEESKKMCYKEIDTVIVESPAIMFNKNISSSVVASLGHISGGAVALFGIDKAHLFRPNEWNKTRKKEVTHNQTVSFLGSADKWHYENRVKSEKYMEHVLDAASMSLWWIKSNYLEE
jgi:Holliday junction resolvasome RuvABC endonuclease subunit